MSTEQARGVDRAKPVARALAVLRTLGEHPEGISLGTLARLTDLPPSTLHRVLVTLREFGLASETDRGLQRIGVGAVALGRAYLDGLDIRDAALPVLRDLTERTGETAHLGLLMGPRVVDIAAVAGPRQVRTVVALGRTTEATDTPVGIAALAHLAPTESEREPGPAAGSELGERLARARAVGYAVDDPATPGNAEVRTVAAPVFEVSGESIGAIGLEVPAYRFPADPSGVARLGDLVRAAADELSRALGNVEGNVEPPPGPEGPDAPGSEAPGSEAPGSEVER